MGIWNITWSFFPKDKPPDKVVFNDTSVEIEDGDDDSTVL